ncbi:hypothetical protein ACHAXT_004104 [Thalassiosira profunda]
MRALLRCAYLLLAVASCRAFAPAAGAARGRVSLSAASTSNDDGVDSRRVFLGNVAAAATSAALLANAPFPALAEDGASSSATSKIKPLPEYLYNVLRVREATEQETRLISTGKFKDVQRANVKLAVKFMINNYKLGDSVVAASSYLQGNAKVQAAGAGQSAVQSLFTIVEYFDSADVENIKVDSLAGKEAIVINGLKSVRRDIDEFLSYFPQDTVEEARKKIFEENELNYKEFDLSLGSILNPNPK